MKSSVIKWLVAIGILVVGAIVMTTLGSTEKETKKRDPKESIRKVEIQTIEFNDFQIKIDGNGIVKSQTSIDVIAEATGLLVYTKSNLKNGTLVRAGEILAEINSEEAQNTVKSLRADFMNTLSTMLPPIKLEKNELFQKWETYFAGLSIKLTVPELPEPVNDREKLMLSSYRIYSSYYAVKNAEFKLSKHTILSPVTGVIRSNGIITGSFVSTGQKLVTVIDYKHVEVSVPLLIDDAAWIDFDTHPPVKIFIGGTKMNWVTGQVVRKDFTLNPNSQTVNIHVNYVNEDEIDSLLPGNYVDIQFLGKILNSVAIIPRSNLVEDTFIYAMEDGQLTKVLVDVISYQQDIVLLSNTIPAGTKLITSLLQKPLIGMPVTDNGIHEKEDITE